MRLRLPKQGERHNPSPPRPLFLGALKASAESRSVTWLSGTGCSGHRARTGLPPPCLASPLGLAPLPTLAPAGRHPAPPPRPGPGRTRAEPLAFFEPQEASRAFDPLHGASWLFPGKPPPKITSSWRDGQQAAEPGSMQHQTWLQHGSQSWVASKPDMHIYILMVSEKA